MKTETEKLIELYHRMPVDQLETALQQIKKQQMVMDGDNMEGHQRLYAMRTAVEKLLMATYNRRQGDSKLIRNYIEESNILIAEFMGADGAPKYNPESWDIYITGHLDVDGDHEEAQHFYTPSEMKYHTSWDWLMPVVNECYHNGADENEVGDITHGLLDCDIDHTYEAIVEFIKQHKL